MLSPVRLIGVHLGVSQLIFVRNCGKLVRRTHTSCLPPWCELSSASVVTSTPLRSEGNVINVDALLVLAVSLSIAWCAMHRMVLHSTYVAFVTCGRSRMKRVPPFAVLSSANAVTITILRSGGTVIDAGLLLHLVASLSVAWCNGVFGFPARVIPLTKVL